MFTAIEKVKDWHDLQKHVCTLFNEMGYKAEIEKIIYLAGRGKKEIDVYIEDPNASHNQVYIIECKYWDTNVNQDVVHGFKTVMDGAGASTGFIISKRGFQSGAYEAIRFTNIQLLTFEELQHLYGNEWYRKKEAKLEKLDSKLNEIYRLHFAQDTFLPIMNNEKFISNGLGPKLSYFNKWVICLSLIIRGNTPENYMGPEPVLLANNPEDPLDHKKDWHAIPTVREYFDVVERAAEKCLEQFDNLTKEATAKESALNDGQFEDQSKRMLMKLREEMPIRVLKNQLERFEYERLLKLLDN